MHVRKKTNYRAANLISFVLCFCILQGSFRVYASGEKTVENVIVDDPYRLVDLYCSQSAKDALGEEQLQALVSLIVTSIEPQAVNRLIECFPCFQDAAANDEIGREIGLYIYYGTGDQDGIAEHENVAPGAYAYVCGGPELEEEESVYKYMICMDAESLSTVDGNSVSYATLDLEGQTRSLVDTIFCHELFHAFMDDYNRVGMSGYTDLAAYLYSTDEELTEEDRLALVEETTFPSWFTEGLAGCVGHIYPADLEMFQNYHYDPDTQQFLDICTSDQLCRMYARMGIEEGTGEERYDLETIAEDETGERTVAATYVSGYMACLYLADLSCRKMDGSGALTFDEKGKVVSMSSEKLRKGLSEILFRLHRGETLDEVIRELSDAAYDNTKVFTERFIKGTMNEETLEYNGDPESLAFCVAYLNYMNRMDAMDPETHPAGSLLMDDFGSLQPTPLDKDAVTDSDFYRIIEKNILTVSTVSSDKVKDGGTSYSGNDSFETVTELFRENHSTYSDNVG